MGKVGTSFSYNVECDVCGFEYKSHELLTRWDGLKVCKHDWEPRHPIDFFKPKNDNHKLPYIRDSKEKKRVFVTVSSDITPVANTWTRLDLDEETADVLAEFDAVTNFQYVPNSNAERKFTFKYVLSQTGGESTLELALYKNGSAVKTIGPQYLYGNGEMSIGGFYIDANATTGDNYQVYYKITTNNGVIKAYDLSTCLEVL